MIRKEIRNTRKWCYLTKPESDAFEEIVARMDITQSSWIRRQIIQLIRQSAIKDVAEV